MTIAVSIKVHDGVVLASDSASTLMKADPEGRTDVVNVYNGANKIFNLVKGLPIAGMTFGAGSIGHASISTLAKDLRKRFCGVVPKFSDWKLDRENYAIGEVASFARRFLFEELYEPEFADQANPPALGFHVSGYSAGADLSELWAINILNGECPEPICLRGAEDSGINWFGEPEAISRLVLGFGSNLPAVLINMGVPEDQIDAAVGLVQSNLEVPLAESPMPIQDAIDLAEFLVNITIMFRRFAHGAPTVGGPIEIVAITKHEGFKWVRRKHYFDTRLNPEARL